MKLENVRFKSASLQLQTIVSALINLAIRSWAWLSPRANFQCIFFFHHSSVLTLYFGKCLHYQSDHLANPCTVIHVCIVEGTELKLSDLI